MTGKCNRRCVIEGRYTLLSGLQCPGVARHGRDMIRHTRPGERSNACYSSTDAPFLFLGPSSLVELHLYIHHPKAGFTAKIKLHPDANHMIQVCTKQKKCQFSKQGWRSDGLWVRAPRLSENVFWRKYASSIVARVSPKCFSYTVDDQIYHFLDMYVSRGLNGVVEWAATCCVYGGAWVRCTSSVVAVRRSGTRTRAS